MIVTFDATTVSQLLMHSIKAATRSPTFDQLYEGEYRFDGKTIDIEKDEFPTAGEVDKSKIPPGLILVGDHGVYLMSNGLPGLSRDGSPMPLNPEPGTVSHLVCYADQINPTRLPFDTWYDNKREAFGGDDGTLFLPVEFFNVPKNPAKKVRLRLTPDGVESLKAG